MSLTNAYATQLLAAEHQQALRTEAAENHLARLARQGRPTLWQRLRNRTSEPRSQRRPAVGFRVHHSTGH